MHRMTGHSSNSKQRGIVLFTIHHYSIGCRTMGIRLDMETSDIFMNVRTDIYDIVGIHGDGGLFPTSSDHQGCLSTHLCKRLENISGQSILSLADWRDIEVGGDESSTGCVSDMSEGCIRHGQSW